MTLSTTDSVKYGLGLTALCGVKAGKAGEDQVLIARFSFTFRLSHVHARTLNNDMLADASGHLHHEST